MISSSSKVCVYKGFFPGLAEMPKYLLFTRHEVREGHKGSLHRVTGMLLSIA